MWKVFIADDEQNIRYGLKYLLEHSMSDIQIIGEAEDGVSALKLIQEMQPDILLVDICMPHLNGLQLIDQINDILVKKCIVIIITGHDEFEYAQKALKLKVFDYILKPVSKQNFIEVIKKAKEELSRLNLVDKYSNWSDMQLKKNMPYLRENSFNAFINNRLSLIEMEEQMEFFGLDLANSHGMVITRVEEKYHIGEQTKDWDRRLLLFAVRNIIEEILADSQPNIVFKDEEDNVIAILPIKSIDTWLDIDKKIEYNIDSFLRITVQVCSEKLKNGLRDIPAIYKKLIIDINNKGSSLPVISLAKKYIEKNYNKVDLSLQEVAQYIKISPNYLSRLLKQSEGYSFTEFLSILRINKAIKLMNNPNLKIHDIAERVGFSTQHYFCTAFKKFLGASPTEYRKSGDED